MKCKNHHSLVYYVKVYGIEGALPKWIAWKLHP